MLAMTFSPYFPYFISSVIFSVISSDILIDIQNVQLHIIFKHNFCA